MNLRSAAREGLGVLVAAVALAIYFTWPLALRPASLGRIDSGDGQFSMWNVGWVAHALTTGTRDVFDANIFHPHRGTLAFSEANLGAGVIAIPAYLITGSAVAAHNSAVLIAFTLSIVGTYVLVRRLTGNREGALIAGILFTFCPYVFAHTAHIQLLMTFGLPWVMLAMHHLVDAPSARAAARLGIALAAQGLFCAYYGMLAGLMVGVGILFYTWSRDRWRQPAWWGLALLATAVSIVCIAPLFAPYLRLQRETGFGRALAEAGTYSADWRAYFASSAWLHLWMLKPLRHWTEVLFPGYCAIGLAAAGITAVYRQRAALPTESPLVALRETTLFYVVLTLFVLWLSFGPSAGLYAGLYHVLPVFSLLRAPSRFGLGVMLGLAVLAGIGVTALLHRFARRRRLVGIALAVAALMDLSISAPYRIILPPAPAYTVLSSRPAGPIVEMPFHYRPIDFHLHARYMFNSTYHWRPLVNGYSDHIPEDFAKIAVPIASFPNPEGFLIFRERRVRYVLFHPEGYTYGNRLALTKRLTEYAEYLRPHVTEGDVWLYEIVRWPPFTDAPTGSPVRR
jgi:hypothetical protein